MYDGTITEAKILVTTPLLFRPPRIIHFFDQVRCLSEFDAALVDLRIITNTFDASEKQAIMDLVSVFQSPRFNVSVQSFWNESDPKQMTWVHKSLIKDEFLNSGMFTHFIYFEDDIRLSRRNFEYFIQDRTPLSEFGFIPSFLRYEYNAKSLKLYTSDVIHPIALDRRTLAIGNRTYVTADNPYCAAFILDSELAEEYVLTDSFDPERSASACRWPSTERSAMGLCFEHVPPGHASRYKIAVDLEKSIPDVRCLIHHLPNNFTDRDWPEGHLLFGKTELLKMFSVP